MSRLPRALLSLLFAALSPVAVNASNWTEGLIACYSFDGDANDGSGNGHHGAVVGATPDVDRFGNPASAYRFDGVDDRIEVPDAVELRLADTDYSLVVWVLEANRSTERAHVVVTKRGSGSANGWSWGLNGPGTLGIGRAVLAVSGGGDPYALSHATLPLNAWQHVAYVYSLSDQTMRVYINGVLDSVHTEFPSPNPTTASSMVIGRDSASTLYHFDGLMDDLRIFSRALSAEEVAQMTVLSRPGVDHESVTGCSGTPSAVTNDGPWPDGLIACYAFDGDANDGSGNGHHGTVVGATPDVDRFGNPGGAYRFDGVDDYIAVPDDPDLRLADTDYSLVVWVLEANRSTERAHTIAARRATGSSNGWIWGVSGTGSFGFGRAVLSLSGGGDPVVLSDATLPTNAWRHVAYVYSLSDQTFRIYINGVLDSVHTGVPSPNPTTSAPMIIGRDSASTLYHFDGLMDDLRIFSRALSAEEVAQMAVLSGPGVDHESVSGCGAELTITCPTDVTIESGNDTSVAATGSATAGDVCGPVNVSHSETTISGGCGGSETITRVWTATDNCGNSASCTQTITVIDTIGPVISCNAADIAKLRVARGRGDDDDDGDEGPVSFTATATDASGVAVVRISDVDCFLIKDKGDIKRAKCEVEIDGDTITIWKARKSDMFITWAVVATDPCGNTSRKVCEIQTWSSVGDDDDD